MDTDLAEFKALLERIDERTANTHEWTKTHEAQDREDFKEVHSRFNRMERKQSWILGVGSASMLALGGLLTWAKDLFM